MKWIRSFITFIEDSIESLVFDDERDRIRRSKHWRDRQREFLEWLNRPP